MEMVKSRLNRGLRPDLYFYRDTQGNEVDLILREGRKLVPIEIKSASTFTEDFVRGIEHFRKTVGSRSSPGYVFYNGDKQLQFKGVRILNPFSHGMPDGCADNQCEGGHK
jgi:hypothetical protein